MDVHTRGCHVCSLFKFPPHLTDDDVINLLPQLRQSAVDRGEAVLDVRGDAQRGGPVLLDRRLRQAEAARPQDVPEDTEADRGRSVTQCVESELNGM